MFLVDSLGFTMCTVMSSENRDTLVFLMSPETLREDTETLEMQESLLSVWKVLLVFFFYVMYS